MFFNELALLKGFIDNLVLIGLIKKDRLSFSLKTDMQRIEEILGYIKDLKRRMSIIRKSYIVVGGSDLHLNTKQINELCIGVKLAAELISESSDLRKFLTIQGYGQNVDEKMIGLKHVITPSILDNILFELRCYELSIDYYINNWDVTDDVLKNEIYQDDIKGILALEIELNKYIQVYQFSNQSGIAITRYNRYFLCRRHFTGCCIPA